MTNRIFPDPQDIIAKREACAIHAQLFAELAATALRTIKSWADPKAPALGKLSTTSRRAAEMLIDALREDGYAADFHWHGSKGGNKHVVQFALDETVLSRAHHDPRR